MDQIKTGVVDDMVSGHQRVTPKAVVMMMISMMVELSRSWQKSRAHSRKSLTSGPLTMLWGRTKKRARVAQTPRTSKNGRPYPET